MARILGKYTNDNSMSRGTPGQGLGAPVATAGSTTPPAPAQNASGNFSNVTDYLKANTQAGERIGTRIGEGIKGALAGSQSNVTKQTGKLGSDLSGASTALQRGEGYQSELNAEGFDAKKFLDTPSPVAGTSGLVAGTQPGAAAPQSVGAQNTQPTPTKLEDFSKFRTGTAVDQSALEKQRSNALGSAITAQQNVGQQQKAVGSEAGRFGLLKSYLGGKDYKQGLQSLDQTFLQQQGQQSLAKTQKDLQDRNKSLSNTQRNLDTEQVQNIRAAAERQKTLSEGLTKRTGELETGYISDLDKQVASTNEKRAADAARYNEFANRITQGPKSDTFTPTAISDNEATNQADKNLHAKGIANPYAQFGGYTQEQKSMHRQLQRGYDAARKEEIAKIRQNESVANQAGLEKFNAEQAALPGLDSDLLKESGLELGQQTFDVLNPNLQASDFIDFDKRTASRGQDIATKKNVDYYKALSDLAGMSNAKLDKEGFLVDPTTGEVSAGAKMAQGEKSLGGRTSAAADKFLKEAMGFNASGQATESYGKRGLSSGSSTTQNAQINAASALTGLPPEYLGQLFDEMSTSALQQSAGQDLAANYFTGGTYGLVKGGGDALTGGALSNLQNKYNQSVQNAVTDIGSNIGLWGGDGPGEAVRAARVNATNQAQAQLQNWLQSKGFGNYLTDKGVKSTNTLTGDKFGYTQDKFAGNEVTGGAGKQNAARPKQRVGINKDYAQQKLINQPILSEEDV